MQRTRRAGEAVLLLSLLGYLAGQVCSLPIVDPGLFVILGVRTCGGGAGYCLLGTDCTLDRDFAADEVGGHCDGLRFAFTPAAHFSCCRYVERSNTTLPGEPADADLGVTEDPTAATTTTGSDAENVIETEVRFKPSAAVDEDGGSMVPVASISPPSHSAHTAPSKPASPVIEMVPVAAISPATSEVHMVPVAAIAPPRVPVVAPLGPANGQTLTAVSEEYKVQGGQDVEEEAEVVAVPGATKEAVMLSSACRSASTASAEVNPCWRSSFQDRAGNTICSGTLVGVDAAVTTAVCANRLMQAGPSAVTLRLGEQSLPVRDVTVHEDYEQEVQRNDIAVVRLFLMAGSSSADSSCIACLPSGAPQLPGKTCFALAARLNGVGVETSAVCAGRVAAQGGQLKLGGCEVASLKTAVTTAESQLQAVRAREGAALLCDGALVGLASTSLGAYSSLAQHHDWLARTLAAPKISTFMA